MLKKFPFSDFTLKQEHWPRNTKGWNKNRDGKLTGNSPKSTKWYTEQSCHARNNPAMQLFKSIWNCWQNITICTSEMPVEWIFYLQDQFIFYRISDLKKIAKFHKALWKISVTQVCQAASFSGPYLFPIRKKYEYSPTA